MSVQSMNDELISIAEEAREHIAYLRELGVENYEASAVLASVALPTPKVETVRTQVPPPRPIAAKPQTITATAAESSFWKTVALPSETLPASGETFEQIWADVGDCTRCALCQGRTNIVHTEGNRKARLMFIGEAPGADEDAQARPFVGRAGQLLTKIIEAIGFKREEVLIGNINRCRPPGNRAPLPDEVVMCKPFLLREIAAAKPEVIVVMGNTAMKNLLDTREGITRARGIFQDYKGVKVMPTFHPAYLLRDPSKKRETWEDLKKVRAYLDSTSRSNA